MFDAKVFSAVLVAAMLMMLAPPASAAETVDEDYQGALGVSAIGYAYGILVNPANDYAPVPGLGRIPAIGGAHLYAASSYDSVVISASDALYGVDAATAACFWSPTGDGTCDPSEDRPSDVHCGPHVLKSTSWSNNHATAWTFAVHVADDLETCGASVGTVTGMFYNA